MHFPNFMCLWDPFILIFRDDQQEVYFDLGQQDEGGEVKEMQGVTMHGERDEEEIREQTTKGR